ncbi:MAG: hydroxymethylglutaryl-CoA lyase [Legionellales bacterium]|nr:hydroxymethylglutaryl-CoA lyase [Legionellales bacterium]
MSLPKQVKIVEVGARDGLQNEKSIIPTAQKIELIERLSDTGLTVIEATSFVSPKWVPQMADHQSIMQYLAQKNSPISYPVLVPNLQGLENALACQVKEIAVFAAASESFSQKNINCSIAESIERFREVIKRAQAHHLRVRGYISCINGCPYEGEVAIAQVVNVAQQLIDLGCYEISLGDTIGVGTPEHTKAVFNAVLKKVDITQIAAHFHNTYGQALANIYAVLQLGIQTIDASVSGLGGCPYAQGASGNVATEDVVYLLNGLGIDTGIDLSKLMACGEFIDTILQRQTQSKVAQALRNK